MDITKTKASLFRVSDLRVNEGQIDGVPANPRQINDADFAKLKKSLQASNLTGVMPLKVYEHNGEYIVLGGNMRLRALQELGVESVSCIVVPKDTDTDTLCQIVIEDNSTFGEWDYDALANEWPADKLQDWGVDVPEFGEESQSIQEDDFDEEQDAVEMICQKGDIWVLGEHRLMCGDSTNADDFALLTDGKQAEISFTSPPYNAGSIDQDGNESTKRKYGEYDDNKSSEDYFKFISTNVGLLLDCSNEVFYNIGLVSGNKREIVRLQYEFIDQYKDIIYWEKTTSAPIIRQGCVNNLVEFILCFGHNSTRRFENAQFRQGTYWNVIKGNNANNNEYSNIHKATFPVYLPENIIKNFSNDGSIVLDCFGGTGTTMIAAEQLGRKCYMMEIDPHYCDVIIARWEKLTGKKAIKVTNG